MWPPSLQTITRRPMLHHRSPPQPAPGLMCHVEHAGGVPCLMQCNDCYAVVFPRSICYFPALVSIVWCPLFSPASHAPGCVQFGSECLYRCTCECSPYQPSPVSKRVGSLLYCLPVRTLYVLYMEGWEVYVCAMLFFISVFRE